MYNPTYWLDEVDEYENRFTETENSDGTITHTKVRGTVLQQGTPQNADNFNNLEYGITDAALALSLLDLAHRQLSWTVDAEIEQRETDDASESQARSAADSALDALIKSRTLTETGTVNLTNTLEFPFNDSQVSVSIPTARNSLNYTVLILSATAESGNVGEIEISDRQINGFKIAYTGSASAVTVTYAVIGGNA